MIFPLDTASEDILEPYVSEAEVLDELCKMLGSFRVARLARGKGFSEAEINILRYKANSSHSGAFPVMEIADENEINKCLRHPMVNHPWPDNFLMSTAAQTPIPLKIMKKMMRKLLREHYEEFVKKAKVQVMARKSEH